MNGPSICTLCDLHELSENGPVCAAFPAGIPADIGHRGFDHRNEYPGDEGVRFVPRKGVTPEQVDQVLSLKKAEELPVQGD